jgi:hypothetical protein
MFDPNKTILAGIPRATLQQYLADAQAAYASLMAGGRPVSVGYEGKTVTYSAANRGDLENWIGLLQRQLGMNCGRRAIRPYYR